MITKNKNNINKILYIPLEIFDREIDGGLLLAFEALKRDWEVIIGSQERIINNIEKSLPGVYFLKHITPGQINIQKRISNSGNIMFVQDQEGLLQRKGLEYKIRFSNSSISPTKKIFFWGDQQKKDFLESFGSKYDSKCIVTGSPRADHWELIARKDNNLDKKYILVATSFSHENHALGEKGQYNLLRNVAGIKFGANSSDSIDEYFEGMYKLGSYLIPFYKKLIVDLSERFKNEKIILRPHPSESLEMWLNLTSDLDNVEIRNDGTIIEWLKISKLLIQYGSSCAIQANILKVPVISLIPNLNRFLRKYDLVYARKASIVCKDNESVISTCEDLLEGNNNYESGNQENLDKLIFSRQTVDAAKRILDEIEKTFKRNAKVKRIKDGTALFYKFSKFKHRILLLVSMLPFWDKIAPAKYQHVSWSTHNYYKKRKQPKLPVEKFKLNLQSMLEISGEKLNIVVKTYLKDVYRLTKK